MTRSRTVDLARLTRVLAAFAWLTAATAAHALGTARFVQLDGSDGVVVAAKGRAAPPLVSTGDFPGVLRAARDVQRDIGKVSGATPAWRTDTVSAAEDIIIAGTLGRHP